MSRSVSTDTTTPHASRAVPHTRPLHPAAPITPPISHDDQTDEIPKVCLGSLFPGAPDHTVPSTPIASNANFELNLNELVVEITNLVHGYCANRSISIHRQFGEIGYVHIPHQAMFYVLFNLIANAIDQISEDGWLSFTTTSEEVTSQNTISLQIRYGGISFPQRSTEDPPPHTLFHYVLLSHGCDHVQDILNEYNSRIDFDQDHGNEVVVTITLPSQADDPTKH